MDIKKLIEQVKTLGEVESKNEVVEEVKANEVMNT